MVVLAICGQAILALNLCLHYTYVGSYYCLLSFSKLSHLSFAPSFLVPEYLDRVRGW